MVDLSTARIRSRTAKRTGGLFAPIWPALALVLLFLAWVAAPGKAQPGPAPIVQEPRTFAVSQPPPDLKELPPPPALLPGAQERQVLPPIPVRQRFQFPIDPKTPLRSLLPIAPKYPVFTRVLGDDLAQVPEAMFEEPLAGMLPAEKAQAHVARNIARIHHVSKKKTDAYMEALLGARSDLSGLPFKMGDDCRSSAERSQAFSNALNAIRQLTRTQISVTISEAHTAPAVAAQVFWQNFENWCRQQDGNAGPKDCVAEARIAALVQVLGPQSPEIRKGLVKYLAGVSHVEATRALAKLAIFSAEENIRDAAIAALKVRRERDYTDILVHGLRYPWPAVAQRTGEAVVKLERKDLIPQLVSILEDPDPRAPIRKEVEETQVSVARELVRINHHRNCLMCHAPGDGPNVPVVILKGESKDGPKDPPPPNGTFVTASIPIPGEPLPSFSQGYQNGSPDLFVRIDVTYLRQDFSLFQPVKDAQPWPEMQRFDFMVRSRVLTEKEAKVLEEKLTNREPGTSPYQRAALVALRELTGQDAAPTGQAWRKLLSLLQRRGAR